MLLLREKQKAEFDRILGIQLEERFLEILHRTRSALLLQLGKEEARKRIRSGLQRARIHGFVGSMEALQLVELTLIFGIGFEEDKANGWALTIMNDATYESASERARSLYLSGIAISERLSLFHEH